MKRTVSWILVCILVLQMLPLGLHTHAGELEPEATAAAETLPTAASETTEAEAPAETTLPEQIPETTAETPAETAAPTVPEETAEETLPEETAPVETEGETLPEESGEAETVPPETEEEILLPEEVAWIEREDAASGKTYYESEPNDTVYQADYFEEDYDVLATLSGQDLDYFAFRLEAKSKISIIAVATRNTFGMALLDSSGEIILKDISGTKNDAGNYIYKLAGTYSAGTYFLLTLDSAQNKTTYGFGILVDPLYEICKHGKKKKQEVVEANCGRDGYTTYYCPTCETSWKANIVPATGDHTYYDQYDSFCDVCRGNRYLGIARGECGDPMNWVIYDDGRMVISGWGDMQLNNGNGMPWDGYKSKIKTLEVRDEVFCIRDHAFENCAGLTGITLAGSVLNIENGAFRNCTSLSSVTLGEGVRRIGDETFGGCTALTSIRIPASVTEIHGSAFGACSNLESFQVASGNTVYSNDSKGLLYNKDKTELIEVPPAVSGTVTIPGTVASFGATFRGCSKLTDVILSNGITSIPWACFLDCTALKSVSLPRGLLVIPGNLFQNCTSLTSVEIPEQVSRLGESAFDNCVALRSVTIPASVTGIESYCFYSCASLNNITIPKHVTEIGYQAFAFCSQLKEITFEGDAPGMSGCFTGVTATAYYPITNTTWTDAVRQNCGGSLTWVGACIDGHVEVIDVPGVAPTCTEEGLSPDSHCSNCGEIVSVQQVLPALGHEVVVDAYLAPTCVDTGLTEGSHCGRCAEILTAQESIPALGHTPAVDACVPPACEAIGLTEGSHCAVCQVVLVAQEIIPALGHAYHEHICTACGRPEFVEVVRIEADRKELTGGEQANLTALLNCPLREGSEILWYLAEGDEEYAVLEGSGENAVLTAKRRMEGPDRAVRVCARTAEGVQASAWTEITVKPTATDYHLFSGKSLTLKPINPATGKAYTAKQLTWELDELYEPYATVKNGKVTAKKVVEYQRIQVVGTVAETGEKLCYIIAICPNVTQVEVERKGAVVNGETLLMDYTDDAMTLVAEVHPYTMEKLTWTVSDKNANFAEYTADGHSLTISNPKGRSGTVTIKATVDAGVKKTVTVKVQFGVFAREVTIAEPAKTTLRGGEIVTLFANISDPVVVTKPGLTWSVSDKTAATVSNGKVTAKNVAHPTKVTVTAISRDGQAADTIELEIVPKNEDQLVLTDGRQYLSGTKAINYGDTLQLSACTIQNGQAVPAEVTWTTSKGSVAYVDNGLVTATGAGTAKITAQLGKAKVSLTVKVTTLVADMEITTKDGKNLIQEEDETLVIVSSGKSVTLAANILTQGAGKAVTWELTGGDEYAKLTAGGKLTANKDLTETVYAAVRATAKDGSGTAATIKVKIVPLATGVQIFQNGNRVRSNTALVCDMLTTPALKLSAKVYPAGANQAVELTSSNKKIADFVDGELKCLKAGTVTITAKALDGSNQKATFKLTVVKRISSLSWKENLPVDSQGRLFVAGGKSLKLAPLVEINPSDATNKKLTWRVSDNDLGIKISSAGVLSTKRVSEPVTVNVMVATQDGSGRMIAIDVLVYPA